MRARNAILLATLIATLTYVSGLAMCLHVAWAHRGDEVQRQAHHCHADHHHHDHGCGHAPAERDGDDPVSDDECPTCVALAAMVIAPPDLADGVCLDRPFAGYVAVEPREAGHFSMLGLPAPRGPPGG